MLSRRVSVLALVGAVSATALAHDVVPPRVLEAPTAPWPAGAVRDHDLVVPVVLTVDRAGAVEAVSVEASVGEPFDSIARETARSFRFDPARDAEGGPVRAKVRAVVRFAAVTPAPPAAVEDAATETTAARPPAPRTSAPSEIIIEGEARARSASESRRERRVLALAPHRTASDLLLTVPGVFVTQHSGEGKAHQIFFRGFDAVHGQDIEFWAAGAPVNEVSNVHGQGYADLHFLMPEIVREVRARPGTYDPRQGDFAVAGSMDFELGHEHPGITAKAGLGSFGARRGFLAYRPPSAGEKTFGAIEIHESDGYGVARAANRASGVAQIEVPLGERVTATFMSSAYASRFGSAGVLRVDDLEAGRVDRFGSYDRDQGGASQRFQLAARVRVASDVGELELAPFFVRRSLALRSNYTGYLDDAELGDSTLQRNDASTFGARAFFRRRLEIMSDADAVEAGLSFRGDFIEQSQRRRSPETMLRAPDVDARLRATNVAGYLDVELQPLRRFSLRGGVRADALAFTVDDLANGGVTRAAQGHHVGAKGTAEVQLGAGLSATASYGQGFRSPQARSLADGEDTPFTEVESQELGLRYRTGRRFAAVIAVYRTTLTDDLVFDEARSRNEPVPGTLRLGAVADVVAEPNDWFTSALGFTFTRATFRESDARYASGDAVPYVPEVVMRMDLGAKAPLAPLGLPRVTGRVGASATALYRRPIPFGELGSDVFLVDAVLGARFEALELSFETWNVLDREWNDGEFSTASSFTRGATPSLVPARHVTAGAPRTYFLSLAVTI